MRQESKTQIEARLTEVERLIGEIRDQLAAPTKPERMEFPKGMESNMPFTAESLADRWECSPQHVRDLVRRGLLPAFRVGRLIRIKAQDVLEAEMARLEMKPESKLPEAKSLRKVPFVVRMPRR